MDGCESGQRMPGLSLLALCDAESSAIGCNAELNEIKIILISVFKHPNNGLRCLCSGRLRGLVGIHVACIELVFEPVGSIFLKIGLKKGTSMYYFKFFSFSIPRKLKANLCAMSRRQRLQQCVPKSKCDSTWVT
jgi:hypothetical protein